MEADATDIRSLQCAARRLSVRACSTSDSAFPNSAERFLSTGCLSSPSGTACALALLLSSCYYNTSILQRQVLVLPHIHIQHSMEVNEDDFASVAPPLRPSDAQQEHISSLRRIVSNRNSYSWAHPFLPTIHKIAPNGMRSLVMCAMWCTIETEYHGEGVERSCLHERWDTA